MEHPLHSQRIFIEIQRTRHSIVDTGGTHPSIIRQRAGSRPCNGASSTQPESIQCIVEDHAFTQWTPGGHIPASLDRGQGAGRVMEHPLYSQGVFTVLQTTRLSHRGMIWLLPLLPSLVSKYIYIYLLTARGPKVFYNFFFITLGRYY